MVKLPRHLRKYIVEQNYEKYTPVNQACWRFVLRQLKNFLGEHAHECYLQGLEKTGVEIESIPRIENISKKLEKFGWRALPVSGFIPPAAFMELQSLGVLPIASDMRTLNHLMYTPAPDIVHEAAGHAPILVNPEFADYLRQYAQVAKKAIISKEDMNLYDAIRLLSDAKENPDSSEKEILAAEKNFEKVAKEISHISEATELSRMNWWTAEYGLIGDIKSPKIFGAGLLSSVGESRLCLSEKVKKIPLTLDCIKMSYDITEPQPQLFVAPDFRTLSKVLDQMANQMAFRVGGIRGLNKAIKAGTVNSAELNSGIQISGQIVEAIVASDSEAPAYIRVQGPSQLTYDDHELPGHGRSYHSDGFGTAIGFFKFQPDTCPSLLSEQSLRAHQLNLGQKCLLEYTSGIRVEGKLTRTLRRDGKLILMSFEDCKVTYFGRTLFEPAWGVFDLAIGSTVTSVFGGPADRESYGETEDFKASRVPVHEYSAEEKLLHSQFAEVRRLREKNVSGKNLAEELKILLKKHTDQFASDWLFQLECFELALNRSQDEKLSQSLKANLETLAKSNADKKEMILDGLSIASHL